MALSSMVRRVATGRMNEVVSTTVSAGHHWPGEPDQELVDIY